MNLERLLNPGVSCGFWRVSKHTIAVRYLTVLFLPSPILYWLCKKLQIYKEKGLKLQKDFQLAFIAAAEQDGVHSKSDPERCCVPLTANKRSDI